MLNTRCVRTKIKGLIFSQHNFVQVTKDMMKFKNKLSPYEGLTLCGQVEQTLLRGKVAYDRKTGFDNLQPTGVLL